MKTVVFDLDGTLIDSAPGIRAAVNKMLEGQGLAPLDLATVTSFIGHGLPKLVARVIGHVGLDVACQDALTAETLALYNADPVFETVLYPGVEGTLKHLKKNGFRIGLCTNKPLTATLEIIGPMGLDGFLDEIVGGDSLSVKKPDPAPLIETFERLGARGPYVGDSEVDAETAHRADTDFALFTGGYRKTPINELPHKYAFSHFDELTQYMEAAL